MNRRMYFQKHGTISVETSVLALYCDCTMFFFFSNFLYMCRGKTYESYVIEFKCACLCVQDHLMGSSAAEIVHDEALLSHQIRDESYPLAV